MARGTRQRQVDLDPSLIDRVKCSRDESNRDAIRRAVKRRLPMVLRRLAEAGLTEIPSGRRRLVSIDDETWQKLERVAALSQRHPNREREEEGPMVALSQIELLRCCLVIEGREADCN